MKTINETLDNRRSYRNYTDEPVDQAIIDDVIKRAQKTATSINGQQISVVVTSDPQKLAELSAVNWGQKHIAKASHYITFVVDYNRADAVLENDELDIQNHIESVIVGAVDAGLMAQSVELQLQALSIGTCMIGGIRCDIPKVKELLGIEGLAFPVLGLAVGNVKNFDNKPELMRPRVESESFYFNEQYNINAVKQGANQYNDTLKAWWAAKDMADHQSYQESMRSTYTRNYMPNELEYLKASGFLSKYTDQTEQD